MRVSLKEAFINSLSKKRITNILLPFFLFLFLLALVIVPNVTFAAWWNPMDWVWEILSLCIRAIAGSLFFLGFLLVKIGVFFTTYLLTTSAVTENWKIIRDLSLGIFGFTIIIIAIMNILKVKIEEWGVNRMIPRLALAVVAVIFSKYACLTLINFSNALANAVTGALHVNLYSTWDMFGKIFADYCTDCVGPVNFYASLMLLLVSIVAWLFLSILGIILLLRALFLAFLVVVSPLAFSLNVMPWTVSGFKKWWDMFIKWSFFYPIALMLLAIGISISGGAQQSGYGPLKDLIQTTFSNVPGNIFDGAIDQISKLFAQFAFTLIALVTIPVAIFVPLKLLGNVGGMIGNAIKSQVGDRVTGKKGIPGVKYSPKTARDFFEGRGKRRAAKNLDSFDKMMRNKFGDTRHGEYITGYTAQDSRARTLEIAKAVSDGPMSKKEKQDYARGVLDRSKLSADKQAWLKDFEDNRGGGRTHVMESLAMNKQFDEKTAANKDVREYFETTGDYEQMLKDNGLHQLRTTEDGQGTRKADMLNQLGIGQVGGMINPDIEGIPDDNGVYSGGFNTDQLRGANKENLEILASSAIDSSSKESMQALARNYERNAKGADKADFEQKAKAIRDSLPGSPTQGGGGQSNASGGTGQTEPPKIVVPNVGGGSKEHPHAGDVKPPWEK